MYDVLIIGGGIIGTTTARALSKYKLKTILIEKRAELADATSKANSGIIHAGYDCPPGTLKAKLNVEGSKMYRLLSKNLNFPFKENGSLVLSFENNNEDKNAIKQLYDKGLANGADVSILNREQILNLEKNINSNVAMALYAPKGAIISPYEATLAFAENAYANGVLFNLNTEVLSIKKIDDYYNITTSKGIYQTKIVVNAAGVYAPNINNMIAKEKYTPALRIGEYLLLDKVEDNYLKNTLFQLPSDKGKGVLVIPTIHNNLLVGPSSETTTNLDDIKTTADILKKISKKALLTMPSLPLKTTITSFSGIRAGITKSEDFIIEEPEDLKGFINTLGINSPGLSAAPAIAKKIEDIVTKILQPTLNFDFNMTQPSTQLFRDMDINTQNRLIKENNAYGKIVCRCETVTEGDILAIIQKNLGATTIDGIKRRTRASMGRCQGGFCILKTMEILANELNIDIYDVQKFGKGSEILYKH